MKLHGPAIRAIRIAKGLTVTEAAKRAGVKQPTWSNWERGARQATAENLQQIREVLLVDDEAALLAFPAPLVRAS